MAHYWIVGLGVCSSPAVVCCQLIDFPDIEADVSVVKANSEYWTASCVQQKDAVPAKCVCPAVFCTRSIWYSRAIYCCLGPLLLPEQRNPVLGVGIVQKQSSVKPTRANAERARGLGEAGQCMLVMYAHRQLVMVIHRPWNEFVPLQRSRGWRFGCMGQVFPYWRCLWVYSFNGLRFGLRWNRLFSLLPSLCWQLWRPDADTGEGWLLLWQYIVPLSSFHSGSSFYPAEHLKTIIFLLNFSFQTGFKSNYWALSV